MLFLYFSCIILLILCMMVIYGLLGANSHQISSFDESTPILVSQYEVDTLQRNRQIYESSLQWADKPMLLTFDDIIRLRKRLENGLLRTGLLIYLDNIYNHYLSMPANERHSIVVRIGDNAEVYPEETTYLAKSRVIGDHNVILQRWNVYRHWHDFAVVRFLDIPWRRKSRRIIWRGVSTGDGERARFAEKYARHPNSGIDVGITNFVQHEKLNKEIMKPHCSVRKQLRYRYIICIEGNDVATALKWVLASNSVCFMKQPKCESWLRESRLRPGVHYVELNNDFSNLEKQYTWALAHEQECLQIVKNANEYMKQFRNPKHQERLSKKVFQDYVRKRHEQIQVSQ